MTRDLPLTLGLVAFTTCDVPKPAQTCQSGAMKSESVTFPNGRGQRLAGRIDYPVTGEPIGYALYAHCFTCSKNLRAIGRITETLAQHGIATLRFDFTGLGESEGDFGDTNFTTSVADFVAATHFLRDNYGAPEVVIGHSLGGAVVLAATPDLPKVRAVVTIGAPSSPTHIQRHLAGDLEKIHADGEAEVVLGGRAITIRDQLLHDIEQIDLGSAVRALGRPLLVLHSPIDNTVGINNAANIFTAARHPKSFVSLDTADHLITDDGDARYAAEVIASWATRYMSGDLTSHSQPDFVVDAPESVTVVRTEKGFRTEVISNGFPLVVDEPKSVGGTNSGPTPYDYLLTALGSCTSMTLRMYADKKEWPLESVTVRLTHRKIHAGDCELCETEKGFIDEIEREIELAGSLDGEQRERLLEIADRCPVHKTMHGEVAIHTRLAEAINS